MKVRKPQRFKVGRFSRAEEVGMDIELQSVRRILHERVEWQPITCIHHQGACQAEVSCDRCLRCRIHCHCSDGEGV